MDWDALLNTLMNWVLNTGIKILISLIVLFISFKVINRVGRKIVKRAEAKNRDKTIVKTLVYAGKILAKCLVAVCLVGFLGIDTSGVTALITSLGVCVGLAVNGALSNLAGGVLLLVTRPFKIDDYIDACGHSGTVEDIRITNTVLRTPDNKVIYLPNASLSTNTIVNYSEKPIRRVDFTFSIGYSSDYDKAKQIVSQILSSNELVLKDPAYFVAMNEHAASSINIVARAWCNNEHYWDVFFAVTELVKKRFDEENIEIPFNQLDVHVIQDKKAD